MKALLGYAIFMGAACVSLGTEAEDLWGCQVLLCLSTAAMFRSAHSPLGTLVVLLFIAPLIAGCMSTQRVPFNNTVGLDRITGVTTRSGMDIPFAKPGAQITNDTLYAIGRSGQVVLPTDSIARVWNTKFSSGRTVGLVLGLVAAAVGVAYIVAAISFSDKFMSSF